MVCNCSDHELLSWSYNHRYHALEIETYDIIFSSQHRDIFERLRQELDTMFD